MSTVAVVAAPKQNAFESFITKFNAKLLAIANAGENIALQEEPIIESLLPPAAASAVVNVISIVGKQLAATESKEAAINASSASWGVKAAQIIAVSGEGLLAVLAQGGLYVASDNLSAFVQAIGQAATLLQLQNITATPVVPAPVATGVAPAA